MRRRIRDVIAAAVQQIGEIVRRAGEERGLAVRRAGMRGEPAVQRVEVLRDAQAGRRFRHFEDRPLDDPARQRDRAIDLPVDEAGPVERRGLRPFEQAIALRDADPPRVVADPREPAAVRDQPVGHRLPDRHVHPELLDVHARRIALLLGLQVIAAVDEQHERGRSSACAVAALRKIPQPAEPSKPDTARGLLASGRYSVTYSSCDVTSTASSRAASSRRDRPAACRRRMRRTGKAGEAVFQSIDHRKPVMHCCRRPAVTRRGAGPRQA